MFSWPERLLLAFSEDLLDAESIEPDPVERERTARWVCARVAGGATHARLGITIAGSAIALGVVLTTGRHYESLPSARRRAIARTLLDSRLPIVADYAHALRSLAVLHVYERRGAPS